jgi:site-specific DNA recombinase
LKSYPGDSVTFHRRSYHLRCSSPAKYVNREKLEQMIISKIKEQILTYENLAELVMLVNEEMDRTASEYRERLNAVSAELENVSRRLGRLYDALETGALALGDLASRIQELRMRQEQLQTTRWELEHLLSNRKVELADMNTVASYVEDLRNLLDKGCIAEKKSFVKSFVREAKVTGSEVSINYTMPVSVGFPSEETMIVPPIVHYGGR